MQDSSLKYDHQFDKVDIEDIESEYFTLKRTNPNAGTPEYLRMKMLRIAMDIKHGYHDCNRRD